MGKETNGKREGGKTRKVSYIDKSGRKKTDQMRERKR